MFKRWTPDLMTKSLLTISLSDLQKKGIRFLLFDMDNTITYWRSEAVEEEIMNWFAHLSDFDMRACICSNSGNQVVGIVADQLKIPYIFSSKKPLSSGLCRALTLIGATAEEAAIVGDQLFTDVWGGNRIGLYTILVEPKGKTDRWGTKHFSRRAERLVMPSVRKNVEKNILKQNGGGK